MHGCMEVWERRTAKRLRDRGMDVWRHGNDNGRPTTAERRGMDAWMYGGMGTANSETTEG